MGIKSLAAKMVLSRASSKVAVAPLSLPLELKGKTLLVLLPAIQRDLTIVKQILPEVTTYFGDRNVFLMACPDTHVESIFPSKGFRIMSPKKSDANWCELPSKVFLDRLSQKKFDYIFDTNLEENQFAARILLQFPEAIRFGSTGHLGLPYINLEVKTNYLRDRRLIYRSILEVVGNLAKPTGPHKTVSEE
ncbi:MAG: hypothetical protein KAR42_02165 [candidate division Zixibacteria bacterium]|nr:hypothetical protein [candidate division Zixibacteria bacterium]